MSILRSLSEVDLSMYIFMFASVGQVFVSFKIDAVL